MTEPRELRKAERYVASEPIPGSFGAASVAIVNMSVDGMMIEHAQPLRVATKGRLWFKQNEISVAVSAILVWSHLSQQPNAKGKYLYRSGVRVESGNEQLAAILQNLATRGVLSLDLESLDRKKKRQEEREHATPQVRVVPKTPELTPDQALLIHHALQRLRNSPEEARHWYNKAKDTAPDDVVKYGKEVVALWSYLEGTVDPRLIAGCLGK